MKTPCAQPLSTVFTLGNCGRSPLRLGVVVMCLVLNTLCLLAKPPADPDSALLAALTNALRENPAALSQATNATQINFHKRLSIRHYQCNGCA